MRKIRRQSRVEEVPFSCGENQPKKMKKSLGDFDASYRNPDNYGQFENEDAILKRIEQLKNEISRLESLPKN